MPEVTRVVRSSYRDRDDFDSDDDVRSTASRRTKDDGSYRTVQRYRVTPSRVEEVEVDRHSARLDISGRGERIEIDRRSERWEPERPRSAVDIRPRSTIVERYVERDPIREPERERTRTVVYEREREPESSRPWERAQARPWEDERNVRETDITRIEKRTTERREEPYELERYQRETEYYDRPEPPPQPIIIRQRAPEPQQIIVQEAPQPPPIILPPREETVQIVRQEIREERVPSPPRPEPRPEPRRQEDEYYYRRDVREVRDGRRSDEDFALERYDRRDVRPRDSVSGDDYSDEDYVIKRKVVRTRDRSRSHSPHHKRHLAEGALAGAGAAALLANHAAKQGTGGEHRGRKVIGGAALGAIGAEVITRARSRYRESRDDSRSRSRSSSRHSHRKIKTAIGLAAAGLAAAAAAKYVSNRKADKAEMGRGRSRTRSLSRRRRHSDSSYDSYDEYRTTRTRSRSIHADPKHRASTIAKAGAATAAVAGVVEHFRNKSRKRSGSRSKSKIRTGAEVVGAGLAGAAVAGLYENRKAKEDEREDEEESRRARRRSRTRSRSRARSVGAYSDHGVDPELGMVQYGTDPVYTHQPAYQPGYDYDPAAVAARGSRSRSRSHQRRHSSSSSGGRRRSRSRSRVRDIAGVAAGTAAAAIGINQYKKRKEKKEADRERERRRYEEEAPPENYYARDYQDDGYSPSPPHASGGSYYPDNNQFPPPPQQPAGFTHHNNQSTPNLHETNIPPYNPADYAGQQPPLNPGHNPYGYPPHTGDNVSNETTSRQAPYVNPTPDHHDVPYFPPPPTAPVEEVGAGGGQHEQRRSHDSLKRAEEGRVDEDCFQPRAPSPLPSRSPSRSPSPSRPGPKSVTWGPLSPTSTRSLARIHKETTKEEESSSDSSLVASEHNSLTRARAGHIHPRDSSPTSTHDNDSQDLSRHRKSRRRRNSDPSSNHTPYRRSERNATRSPSLSSSDNDEVEILPDRFDADGRPLDRHGNAYHSRSNKSSGIRGGVAWLQGDSRSGIRGGTRSFNSGSGSGPKHRSRSIGDERDRDRDSRVSKSRRDEESEDEGGKGGHPEMVEKWAKDFGDVFEGKKSWKDLLSGIIEQAGGAGGGSEEGSEVSEGRHGSSGRRRRRSHRH